MRLLVFFLFVGVANAETLSSPMAILYSARVCHLQSIRSDLVAEIAKQKKYAKLGGVENMQALYDLQEQIRSLDERVQSDRDDLGAQLLSCRARMVRAALYCPTHDDEICNTNPGLDEGERFVTQFDSEYQIP